MDRTLRVGLYEQLITEELAAQLAELATDGAVAARVKELLPAEAPDCIAVHLGRIIRRAVAALPEQARTSAGLALARGRVRHLVAPNGEVQAYSGVFAAAGENQIGPAKSSLRVHRKSGA